MLRASKLVICLLLLTVCGGAFASGQPAQKPQPAAAKSPFVLASNDSAQCRRDCNNSLAQCRNRCVSCSDKERHEVYKDCDENYRACVGSCR